MLPPSNRPSTTRLPNRPKSSVPTSIFSVQFGLGIARSLIKIQYLDFRAHKGNAVLTSGGYGEISRLARQEPVALYLLAHGANPELPSEFDGVTPMQAAHRVGLTQVVAQLHQMGVPHPPEPPAPTGWLEKWLAAKAKHWNKAWATKP